MVPRCVCRVSAGGGGGMGDVRGVGEYEVVKDVFGVSGVVAHGGLKERGAMDRLFL